jgi:pimeloyl-ACP methyl ester carboxylesterase
VATYVLVHGAWGGAHGFHKMRPPLRAAGHEVFTPSLTGVGERSHLTGPQVNLSTHVHDVVNHVLYEDLDGIVLLGFSYGGMVVTGALAHIAERVRHLVFLDAFVPGDGDSLQRLIGRGSDPARIEIGAPWLIPPMDREFDDPLEGAWIAARRTPHPAACFGEAVRLEQPLEAYPFTRTYVKALDDPRVKGGSPFWDAADRARSSPAWRYHEVDTNHMIPNNRPERLADILLELA